MIFIDCCILESLCKYSNNLIFSVERVGWKGICQIVVTFKFPECSGLSRRVYAPAVGWNLITLLFDSRTLYRVLQNPDDIHSEEARRNLLYNNIVRWVWDLYSRPQKPKYLHSGTRGAGPGQGAVPFIHSLHLWQHPSIRDECFHFCQSGQGTFVDFSSWHVLKVLEVPSLKF